MEVEELNAILRRKMEHVLANLSYQFIELKELLIEEEPCGTYAKVECYDSLIGKSSVIEGHSSTLTAEMTKEDISGFIFEIRKQILNYIAKNHGKLVIRLNTKEVASHCPSYAIDHLGVGDRLLDVTLDSISDAGANKEAIFLVGTKKYFYEVSSTIRWKAWCARQYVNGLKDGYSFEELSNGIYGNNAPITFAVFMLNLLISEGAIDV